MTPPTRQQHEIEAVPGPHRTRIGGHLWTLRPRLRELLWKTRAPDAVAWSTTVADDNVGPVQLTGELRDIEGNDTLVVIVHGLGGAPDSVYVRRAASDLARQGYPTLSLALRGADLRGEDFYNGGLVADLHATMASPTLARFDRIFVIGFSMGGHVTLHLAHAPRDPRVLGVAAICSPLHLKSAQLHIDSGRAAFYRRYVLHALKRIYAAVAARRSVPTPLAQVKAARTIREWDRLTIAPRYGFETPEHYYREMSIAPHLGELQVPSLLVVATEDPLVPLPAVEPFLPASRPANLTVRKSTRGGHVAFPASLDLGFDADRGLIPQLTAWFEECE